MVVVYISAGVEVKNVVAIDFSNAGIFYSRSAQRGRINQLNIVCDSISSFEIT